MKKDYFKKDCTPYIVVEIVQGTFSCIFSLQGLFLLLEFATFEHC